MSFKTFMWNLTGKPYIVVELYDSHSLIGEFPREIATDSRFVRVLPYGDFEVPDTDEGKWYKRTSQTKIKGVHVLYDIKSARSMIENRKVPVKKEVRTEEEIDGITTIKITYKEEMRKYTYLELVPNFFHPKTLMAKINARSIEKTLAHKKSLLEHFDHI